MIVAVCGSGPRPEYARLARRARAIRIFPWRWCGHPARSVQRSGCRRHVPAAETRAWRTAGVAARPARLAKVCVASETHPIMGRVFGWATAFALEPELLLSQHPAFRSAEQAENAEASLDHGFSAPL